MVKKNFLKSSLIVLAVLAIALIPTASVNASGVANSDIPALAYSAHVQSFGWMGTKNAGKAENDSASIAGTEGLCKRVEALRVTFEAPEGVVLKYNAHIQGIGWTGWTKITETNQLIGTEGQQKRLEAIKFSVTGLEGYEIKYRAHVQGYGWMDWLTADASEGLAKIAGTQGECKRIESLQFLILDSEAAEVFDFRQETINALRAYAVPGEFTLNKAELANAVNEGIDEIKDADADKDSINEALKTAKGYVDVVMNDAAIREAAKTLNGKIDKWLEDKGFNVEGQYGAVKTVVSKEPEVASAIKAAKEGILKHDKYNTDNMEVGGEYHIDACDTIREGIREYVFRKANELYNATYEKNKTLYTKDCLDATYLALGVDEDGLLDPDEKLSTDSEIDAALNSLKLTDSWTLEQEINKAKNALKSAWSIFNQDISSANQYKYVNAKIVDVYWFKGVSYIKDAMAGMEEDLDKAQNCPQIMEKVDAYETKVLNGLTTFVERLITKLSTRNDVGILSEQQIKTIRGTLTVEEPDIAIITSTVRETLGDLAK